MSSYPLLGEIMMWGGNFAPKGWAFCNGQVLSVNQNMALFSLLGSTYGGDGRTTFALPDLRSRIPMGTGSGPGLTPRYWGNKGGAENVILETAALAEPAEPDASRNAAATETGTIPVAPPSLAVNFVICLYGEYPCRD
jgi:microcystin-dependent protein